MTTIEAPTLNVICATFFCYLQCSVKISAIQIMRVVQVLKIKLGQQPSQHRFDQSSEKLHHYVRIFF